MTYSEYPSTQLAKHMKLISTSRFLQLAEDRCGSLARKDNLDSARIWLQGKVNSYRADYFAGHASFEQVQEVEAALANVQTQLAA